MKRKRMVMAALIGPTLSLAVPSISQAQSACPISSYLTEGRRGSDQVRCLQTALNDGGYESGPVDGWFGPVTRGAVVRYQEANGLVVDGEVGSQTAGALGLWVARAAAPAARQRQQSSSSSSNSGGGSVWDRVAQCESGGNWSINTGNGYSGGLQFLHSSWRAYGGDGQAWQHSREEQIAVAERILDDVGWQAWPACSRKLGLR